MSVPSPQYEFTPEQNTLLGGLAHRMGWVGFFLTLVGIFSIISALLLVAAIYRNDLPQDWVSKAPPEVQEQLKKMQADLPSNNRLWGMVINNALVGLLNLLLGGWTRTAAASFEQIVKTQGSDMNHLMRALGSLNSMYTLMYTLLVFTLILVLISLGLGLYAQLVR